MKKLFVIITALFLAFSAFSETRTFYFTRHGQRGDPKYQKKFKHLDEDILMPKGEEQAKLLGQYLNSIGFNGRIYVSPFYRTLQTATIAAKQLPEMPVIIEPRIQENAKVKDNTGIVRYVKKGLTKKEIKENFPNVKIPKRVKFPWRVSNEKQEQMDQRVSDFIDYLLKKTEGDIFAVSHGGCMGSIIREMNKRGADFPRKVTYNCCLYAFTFDTETEKVIKFSDETLNYLPDELITDNLAYMLLPPERN